MAYGNSVVLMGNLVEDPEVRFTPQGVARVHIRLAVNHRWKDASGQAQEETSFFSGVVWRQHAENIAESLTKGMRVVVVGSLQQRTWETPAGERRSAVEVKIDEVAPSLRWATADMKRTESRSNGDQGRDEEAF